MSPHETELDLPVYMQESPAEACIDSGLLQCQGHGKDFLFLPGSVLESCTFKILSISSKLSILLAYNC